MLGIWKWAHYDNDHSTPASHMTDVLHVSRSDYTYSLQHQNTVDQDVKVSPISLHFCLLHINGKSWFTNSKCNQIHFSISIFHTKHYDSVNTKFTLSNWFKEIVHPKLEPWNFTHLHGIQDEFVSSSEQQSFIRSHLARSKSLKLKHFNDGFVSYKHASEHINWWNGVVWITCGLLWFLWLSFWRHPFTAEDALVSKWCNAKFLQICSDEETNSSISWMAGGWAHFQQMFTFE